jgi:acyl-CoA synthetase (AMP-forming)/AMP-acid ligase II
VYSNVGIQSMALIARLPVALVPNPRDIADLLATVKKVKPAFFNGVPTMYIALLNQPDVKNGKPTSSRSACVFSGASALLADTKQRFEAITTPAAASSKAFADRGDDGVDASNPVIGREQTRFRRHAAARRARPDCRRRRGYPDAACERGRRDYHRRATTDVRYWTGLRKRRRLFVSIATNRRRGGGFILETSVISTKTVTMFHRRSQKRSHQTKRRLPGGGLAKSKKCWRRTRSGGSRRRRRHRRTKGRVVKAWIVLRTARGRVNRTCEPTVRTARALQSTGKD